MEKIRPILYGVADYAQIRKKNAWFVDRTAKIRDLESIAYVVFLRPRRFGKSLLLSILEAYYDVAYEDRFEQLFSGTDIGADPTEERNSTLFSTSTSPPSVRTRDRLRSASRNTRRTGSTPSRRSTQSVSPRGLRRKSLRLPRRRIR